MQVIEKPWGKEEILEINSGYMFKRLTMYKGHKYSLQLHNYKRETIYVLRGVLKIRHGPSLDELFEEVFAPGGVITLEPGVIHRMEAVEEAVYLEGSTPEMDDVVRFQDDYKRV
jgi:mannose-6-phosphate isomerase-like protein (cupin superfamily)